jgi:hypothetical protein
MRRRSKTSASAAQAVIDEESEVMDKQQAGKPVSYIPVSDGTDGMPTSGDTVNDITLAPDEDTGVNPLFGGYPVPPATLPINNVFSVMNVCGGDGVFVRGAFGRMSDFN